MPARRAQADPRSPRLSLPGLTQIACQHRQKGLDAGGRFVANSGIFTPAAGRPGLKTTRGDENANVVVRQHRAREPYNPPEIPRLLYLSCTVDESTRICYVFASGGRIPPACRFYRTGRTGIGCAKPTTRGSYGERSRVRPARTAVHRSLRARRPRLSLLASPRGEGAVRRAAGAKRYRGAYGNAQNPTVSSRQRGGTCMQVSSMLPWSMPHRARSRAGAASADRWPRDGGGVRPRGRLMVVRTRNRPTQLGDTL